MIKTKPYTREGGKYKKNDPETMRRWDAVNRMAHKMCGGVSSFYKRSKEDRKRFRAEAAKHYNHSGNVVKIKPNLPKIYKDINRKPPLEKRIDYPKEGYVYVFKSPRIQSYKIGKTDDVGRRLSEAQTWAPYYCEHYTRSDDCVLLERMVHNVLEPYRVKWSNLGREHFLVTLDHAIQVIENESKTLIKRNDAGLDEWPDAAGSKH